MPARTKRKAVEEPKEEVKSAKVLNNLAYFSKYELFCWLPLQKHILKDYFESQNCETD